jgi:glycosyltransferase involved in cell wall biosynthesis
MMRILLISPFHGGSHRSWATGYLQNSQNEVELLTLPDRFWKWRMHGGSVTLSRRFNETHRVGRKQLLPPLPHVILATDMVDLTTFQSLTRRISHSMPAILYMHENQITYPLPDSAVGGPMRRQQGERDLHYGFINYASMMAADLVLFNSEYHRSDYFYKLPSFLKHFPEFNELETIPLLIEKSEVMPVGVDIQGLNKAKRSYGDSDPPLILWNQRWEYDKNPGQFFAALYEIAQEGIPFRLAVCGANFRQKPAEFEKARVALAGQIVHWGYADSEEYKQLLWDASITISTAHHEFFGISIVEAVACNTFPILPRRLSYPELLPASAHHRCLYSDYSGLMEKLRWSLTNNIARNAISLELASHVAQFDWRIIASQYDTRITSLVDEDIFTN